MSSRLCPRLNVSRASARSGYCISLGKVKNKIENERYDNAAAVILFGFTIDFALVLVLGTLNAFCVFSSYFC